MSERTIEDILSPDNLDCLDIAQIVIEQKGQANIGKALLALIIVLGFALMCVLLTNPAAMDNVSLVAGIK